MLTRFDVCLPCMLVCLPALQSDPAWPGPCYGAVPPAPLEPAQSAAVVALLRDAFATIDL